MRTISKSKFMSGRQCAKRLWQEIHHPERADDYGVGTEFTFFRGTKWARWRSSGVATAC